MPKIYANENFLLRRVNFFSPKPSLKCAGNGQNAPRRTISNINPPMPSVVNEWLMEAFPVRILLILAEWVGQGMGWQVKGIVGWFGGDVPDPSHPDSLLTGHSGNHPQFTSD